MKFWHNFLVSFCSSNDRYSSHLERCRRNFVVDTEKKGIHAKMVNCSVRPNHQVYSPELLYHEHICPDKFYMEVEALYLKEPELWQAKLRFIESEVNGLKEEKNLTRIKGRLIELDMSLDDNSTGKQINYYASYDFYKLIFILIFLFAFFFIDGFENVSKVTEYMIMVIRERKICDIKCWKSRRSRRRQLHSETSHVLWKCHG